jgi:hypothetical protein
MPTSTEIEINYNFLESWFFNWLLRTLRGDPLPTELNDHVLTYDCHLDMSAEQPELFRQEVDALKNWLEEVARAPYCDGHEEMHYHSDGEHLLIHFSENGMGGRGCWPQQNDLWTILGFPTHARYELRSSSRPDHEARSRLTLENIDETLLARIRELLKPGGVFDVG